MSYSISHVATAMWKQCKSENYYEYSGPELRRTSPIPPKVVKGTVVADGVVGISSTTLGILSLFVKSLTPLAPFAMPLIGVGSGILGSDALCKMLRTCHAVLREDGKELPEIPRQRPGPHPEVDQYQQQAQWQHPPQAQWQHQPQAQWQHQPQAQWQHQQAPTVPAAYPRQPYQYQPQ